MTSNSISIVGTGKLGSSLAIALKSKGFEISGLYSIGGDSQKKLCRQLGICLNNDLIESVSGSNIIFITVPDSQIANVSRQISQSANVESIKNKYVFHMSGALTSDELADLERLGALTGSLHPIQTFAGTSDPEIFEGVYFGFEGSCDIYPVAKDIVDALNGKIVKIEKENKPIYHACACIISNYTVTLSHMVEKLLRVMKVENEININAFMPLLKGTVPNIEKLGSVKSLTGPISRGDINVIKGHIDALNDRCGELERELYNILGIATADLALEKGSIGEKTRLSIHSLLNDRPELRKGDDSHRNR
ncbi:MAG TPA: DUF2520 domain-containing protein [Pseudobacteroides sp.]|nr:DUF2520 domain-containing protein [Pseudobacteroides sp.]